jgi:deazaflavin-dependent oxidoreductase (nitroreductase family)
MALQSSTAPTNPDWYHNLVANPEVTAEIGTETRRLLARAATGAERDRIRTKQTGLASVQVRELRAERF